MFRIFFILLFTMFISCNQVFSSDDFYMYIKHVKEQTEKFWNPPVYHQKHVSQVRFRINKDGSVSNVKLVKTSNVPQLDKRAVETIKQLPNLKRLPSFYVGDYIEITMSMTNFVYEDMKNPLIYEKKKNINRNKSTYINTKNVKIQKVYYPEFFYHGASNFEDKMKKIELNLDIQKSVKKKKQV